MYNVPQHKPSMQPCDIAFSHKKDDSKLNGTSTSPYPFYVMRVQHCWKKDFERIRAAKPLWGGRQSESDGFRCFSCAF